MRPSALPEVYWSHTLNDLKKLVGLKTQYEAAQAYQNYENLVLVASQIFGSSKPKAKVVETFDELAAFINGL